MSNQPLFSNKGFALRSLRSKRSLRGNEYFSTENFVNNSIHLDLLTTSPHHKIRTKSSRLKIMKKLKCVHTKQYARFFRKLPTFIKLVYGTVVTHKSIYNFLTRFEGRILENGFQEACVQFKSLASWAQRYAAGHRSDELKRFSLVSGYPKILNEFRDNIEGSLPNRTSVLLILDLPKLYGLGTNTPKVDSIIAPGVLEPDDFQLDSNCYPGRFFDRLGQKSEIPDAFYSALKNKWSVVLKSTFPDKYLEDRINTLKRNVNINISTKAGPNAPNLVSSPQDFIGMINTNDFNGKPLIDTVKELAHLTDHKELLNIIDFFDNIVKEPIPLHGYGEPFLPKTGKLSVKQEVFGKSRLIAIIDFFTQSSLYSLHKAQFEWLSHQIQDGTFDQDLLSSKVRELSTLESSKENSLFSLDLTTATDRLPIDLQFEIVCQQFGRDVARKWYILCCQRPFSFKGENLYYSVGQPMGTYSSWSNLAVCNHLMARTAILLSNLKLDREHPQYFIIGDDFVCRGIKISTYYTRILTLIGVKISELKGYIPFTSRSFDPHRPNDIWNSVDNVVEIAKRVFVNGVELTPLRPSDLFQCLTEPIYFKSLISSIWRRIRPLTSDEVSKISNLTYKPLDSCKHLVIPFNHSIFLEWLLGDLSDLTYREKSYTLLLNNNDVDGTPLYLKDNNVVKALQLYTTYTTVGELEDKIYEIFSSEITSKMYNSLKKFSRFLTEESFRMKDERKFNPLIPTEYLSGFTIMLDFILLCVYKHCKEIFKDCQEILANSLEDRTYVIKICTLLTSVNDITLLLRGKIMSDPKREAVSKFVRETEDKAFTIFNRDSKSLKQNQTYFNYADLESLFLIKERELNGEKVDPFDKFRAINSVQSEFIRSKEGFKSLLSKPVASAMEYLAAKFGFGDLEGPSLLKGKVKIDNETLRIVFDSASTLVNIKNVSKLRSREDLLNSIHRSNTPKDIISEVLTSLT